MERRFLTAGFKFLTAGFFYTPPLHMGKLAR